MVELCQDPIWRMTSGSSGNIGKHVKSVHHKKVAPRKSEEPDLVVKVHPFDEWSDGRGLPYLGLKVHGCYTVEETVRYQGWCLGHVPLEGKTAEALATATLQILNDYGIEARVTFIVSDTTAVMPATARLLKKTAGEARR
jgi:hypothetical protein